MATSKSKTTRKRPGYVPKEGLFFDIKPRVRDCRIWHNGKLLKHVMLAAISIDPSNGFVRAQLDVLDFNARVEVDSSEGEVRKRCPSNSAWGVTEKVKPSLSEEFKEKLQAKAAQPKNPAPLRPPHQSTPAGISRQISKLDLSGIQPFYDVTVTEDPVTSKVLIKAAMTKNDHRTLTDAGWSVEDALDTYVSSILPAGCTFHLSLHFTSN